MLSMLNQFYNYISTLLLDYFDDNEVRPGDRFSLQLDRDEEVEGIVNALEKNKSYPVEEFVYDLGTDGVYKTFSIPFAQSKLLIAFTSKYVKPDFLVTLRNLVGEQLGQFKDTSLVSIVSEQLDSIQGGSSDLQKEGMPLHPEVLYANLQKDISNSNLDDVEQLILKDSLKKIMHERQFEEINFFDFEDIFTTLEKGHIKDEDYHKFGMFKDVDLGTYPKRSRSERLQKNQELFEDVQRVHEYGLSSEELENSFSPEGSRALIKEDWMQIDFSDVYKYHLDFERNNKQQKVELDTIRVSGGLNFWQRVQNEKTAAGRRKHHLVIFNDGREEIEIQARFNLQGNIKSLSENYVRKHGDDRTQVEVKTTNIFMKITSKGVDAPRARIVYRHDRRAALGVEINLIVVPFEETFLESFRTRYLVNEKKGIELQFEGEEEELVFGDKLFENSVDIVENNQIVPVSQDEFLSLKPLPESFNEEREITVNLQYEGVSVPLVLINELPESTPISARNIWKLVRESNEDMQWITENNRLVLGNREWYFHSQYREYFEWEKRWVSSGFLSAEFVSGELNKFDIDINKELMEKYHDFINYFLTHPFESAIPSLCAVSDEYFAVATSYIKQYCVEVEQFSSGRPAGKRGTDLFRLGVITSNDQIYLTPFHPLMVAYKLKVYELLDTEVLDSSILNRLNPEALIPFLYDDQSTLFKPEPQHDALDWIVLKPVKEVSISDSNNYLAQVVTDKMSQFKEHFSYLFMEYSLAPLLINVININNDKEMLRGVVQWMISEIRKYGLNGINPIELTLYQSEHKDSSFDLFSVINSIKEIEDQFEINLKIRGIDKQDVLNCIRENLTFYKQSENEEFRYAHISFYNMHAIETYSIQPMNSMVTGISIDGLYSSIPSMRDEESYVSGFGLRAYSNYNQSDLLKVAYYVNELAVNIQNGGNNSYRKGEAVFSRISSTDEDLLQKIFKASYWVTFIDPHIDLDFFNDYKELVIIHYSDQYSSSNKYDAITVTDKSSQYFSVIDAFLKEKNVEVETDNIDSAIKAFNTFNGEWLLRIIGSKGHYDREKLSIISAIKYALSYFDHPNILWVPISMEEVLRVAGVVGLSKSDGVFTSRNLGITGSQSDDLLLIGLEKVDGNITLHFYPVEVKIGINDNQTINKGRKQVLNTKNNIINQLVGDQSQSFAGKFYRNFFVHLFLANARKMDQNNIWPEKNYKLSDNIIQKLLQDDYEINESLSEYIGDGAIVSFRKGAFHRSAEILEGVLLLHFIEEDGHQGLIKNSNEINQWLHESSSDFIKDDMIYNSYAVELIEEKRPHETVQIEVDTRENKAVNNYNQDIDEKESKQPLAIDSEQFDGKTVKESSNGVTYKMKENVKLLSLQKARIKLGTAENSNKEVFWEYGNKSLANRHLLISGKSGQGKTYFMQCVLLEKSKIGIPSIVIDYTEGFLPNQLEPEFQQFLGDKLVQKIVYNEKLPMNPFHKNIRDIGGIQLEESHTDVAERISGVFKSVYKSLGIQQLNAIYDAIQKGVDRYGDDMNLMRLSDLLERDGSNYARTALSQIRPLIDRNPFNNESILNWKDMLESNGNVYIIQLAGFNREVQLMITEFILWDLWNFSVKYGHKDFPIPVVMDEAQNLDHTSASPSARILTEGRKFGWSAWYATQFLRSQLDADELARLQNSSQKIYFAPPEQELSNIAATFTKDTQERRYWESKLASLKLGQCIVHAPVLQANGELSSPTVTVVDIWPLGDRIK